VALLVVSSVVVGQVAAAPVGTDDTVTASEAAAALADVANVMGPSASTAVLSEGFVAAAAGSVAEMPRDPAEGLSLTTATGASIEIGLPGAESAEDGVRQTSGHVVYADAAPDVAVAAQATPDGGLRALVVIDGPLAPKEYRFALGIPAGSSLAPGADGGARVLASDGGVLAFVAAPWAVDADGTPVETDYRIDGSTLVQRVEHVGARYPVVADPKITFGWSVYLYMTGAEIASLGSALVVGGGAAGIAVCEGVKQLPSALTKLLKRLCIVVGGPSVLSILKNLEQLYKSVDPNACYEAKLGGRGFAKVGLKNC
jgi:hypothetical protein